MGQCGLFLNGREVGRVDWHTENGRVLVQARCPFEERYIYRVCIRGESGDALKLGVMAPQNGSFVVCRSIPQYSAGPLRERGAAGLRAEIVRTLPGQELKGPFPFSLCALEQMPADCGEHWELLLRQCAQKACGLRYKKWGDTEYLVFPLQEGREMAFAPFFCLVTPIALEGEMCGVLCVNREGEICRFCPETGGAKTDSFF